VGVSEKPQATSSPNLTVTYDTRDSIFDPLRGWTHKWFAQVAGGPTANVNIFGGDAKFYKVQYDASVFVPSPVNLVIIRPSVALHGRVGRGWGFDHQDVPIFEKFFLGGTDSIRGYQERELGPRDASTGRPAGGLAMAQFNAELKWPVYPRVVTIAAPFYDVGNAWDTVSSLDDILHGPADPVTGKRTSPLATAVGVGFRLTIPGTIIVIRLDYGWGLTKEYGHDIRPGAGKLHFNIGNIF
jgi:outer membrane protein insertion porin family